MTNHYQTALAAFEHGDITATFHAINAAMTSPEAGNPAVFALLGEALLKFDSTAEAGEAYEEAAKRGGPFALDHHKRAIMLHEQAGNRERAFLLSLQYQKIRPDDADVIYILAQELKARGETDLLKLFENKLVASDNPAHLRLATELIGDDNRNPHNLVLFKKLVAGKPDDPFTRFKYYSIAREFCDYMVLEEADRYIRRQLGRGNTAIFEGETPYSNLLHCSDEALNRLATNNRDLLAAPPGDRPGRRRRQAHHWGDRIRIGYLSSDFWDDHATMRLLQSVIEAHDRSRFDITLFDYTPEKFVAFDGGGRARWQKIVSIRDMSDEQAAAAIRAHGCDILVDLKGHTGGSRSKILNRMVAPVQASWLGFPGSVANVDLDYVIGDATVLPDSSKRHYHEKFCRLPDSYQPNDPVYRPLPAPTARAALGLPEDKFVFASFNASRKITLETIDLWAEIIRQAENAVLWVMLDHEEAKANFLARLRRNGVDGDRVILAAKTDYASHVARLQAADLGLDTFPYNGHTTTSDKLWAGLPVLTRRGGNFASRVSESLLKAAGLPELVAPSTEAFFATALELCEKPEMLAGYKARLAATRNSVPLFDHLGFARKLERAYGTMASRARAGLPPEHFDVV